MCLNVCNGTTSLADIADSQLLIGAIPERLELKHALYTELETLISPEAIVASNTSGLPPDDLAAKMRYPQRLLIAHFWHPPHFIPLVEIIPGSVTEPKHLHWLQHLLVSLQLEAVLLDRAAPDLSATVCNLHCCVKPHIVKAASPVQKWWIRVMRASLGRRYAMVGPLEAAGHDRTFDGAGYLSPSAP